MNEMIEKKITHHAIQRFKMEQISEGKLNHILQTGLYVLKGKSHSW